MKRDFIFTKKASINFHREANKLTKIAWFRPSCRILLDPEEFEELSDSLSASLLAVNKRSRIAYSVKTANQVARYLAGKEIGNAYFLTLAPDRYAVSLEEAEAFDTRAIRRWAKELLDNFHYVACIEAGFHSKHESRRGKWVSWHVHAIVWCCSRREIGELVSDLNSRSEAFLRNARTAHVRHLNSAKAIKARVYYMLKAPKSDHRSFSRVEEEVDPETGEVRKRPTGKYTAKKREIRPKDMLRMVKVLSGRRLTELVFSGGDGRRIQKRAEKAARDWIIRDDERRRDKTKMAFVG